MTNSKKHRLITWAQDLVVPFFCLFLASCNQDHDQPFGGYPYFESEPLIIDSHEIWRPGDSPIIIDQDVHVTASGVLEILPGTIIDLVENSVEVWDPAGNWWRSPNFLIEGTLICSGKPDSMIIFSGSDDESHTSGEVVKILADNPQFEESVIEWTQLIELEWHYGKPHVVHCDIWNFIVKDCEGVYIDSNILDNLSVINSSGIIQWNVFEGNISAHGSTMQVSNNVFRDLALERLGAISCWFDSNMLITENLIIDCGLAIYVYSSTPELHRNNFIANEINMAIQLKSDYPYPDTLDATNNWWGLVDSAAIASTIQYWENGDDVSQTIVKFVPFATRPFSIQ